MCDDDIEDEITPEMIEAGVEAGLGWFHSATEESIRDAVEAIYLAMRSARNEKRPDWPPMTGKIRSRDGGLSLDLDNGIIEFRTTK